MESTDYIIVGSGLAGITLAHALNQKGLNFKIISVPEKSSSSKVAPGLFNPVVFFRLTKSYMADLALPFAMDFYEEAGKLMGENLIHKVPLAKLFANENEVLLWEKRREEGVGIYLGECKGVLDASPDFKMGAGYGIVKHTGYLDCEKFLNASLQYFKSSFVEEIFNYEEIKFQDELVEYKGIKAKKIIFCEGHLLTANPFFGGIAFKPVKGETLIIEFEKELPEEVRNFTLVKKCYLLPMGNKIYKVGATYNWSELNEEISEAALQELSQHIRDITEIKFKVLKQMAGVRPAAADRRPVIGLHPQHPQIGIFNGLGTKGVMLAPYYANALVESITEHKVIHKEVNVRRLF